MTNVSLLAFVYEANRRGAPAEVAIFDGRPATADDPRLSEWAVFKGDRPVALMATASATVGAWWGIRIGDQFFASKNPRPCTVGDTLYVAIEDT